MRRFVRSRWRETGDRDAPFCAIAMGRRTHYTHPSVLVIDEVGYLTYGDDAANVLFHVVNERHLKKRSMIFTTNKPLRSWGRVLHDEDLAQAIVDRVLERGRLLELDGPSGRTRHLPLDLDPAQAAQDEPARVSGTAPAKFPEPAGAPDRIASRARSSVASAPLGAWRPRPAFSCAHASTPLRATSRRGRARTYFRVA